MNNQNQTQGKLYETQVSLTEWFEKMGHTDTIALREEDNEKRERLKVLAEIIGLPFDRPEQCEAVDIFEDSSLFHDILNTRGHELCAIRLIPKNSALPKLRMRGLTLQKATEWAKAQEINPKEYRADIVPHAEVSDWSTIFVVNSHGIFGEIIRGGHFQLTQGFYQEEKPVTFVYNFSTLTTSEDRPEITEHLKRIISYLHVPDKDKQKAVQEELQGEFANNYLHGYFETASSKDFGIWFIDYNRLLGNKYNSFHTESPTSKKENSVLNGRSGSGGKTIGKVKIIAPDDFTTELQPDEILVTTMTVPHHLPLMRQAKAIVTDIGGILSHAAIVSRELKKPCVVGTGSATTLLKDGDLIEVDGDTGNICRIRV